MRPAPEADVERLAALVEESDYRIPEDPAAHAVALDSLSLGAARRGSLYPDHVVFLGPGLVEGAIAGGRLHAPSDRIRPPPMLALPGVGVVLHRSTSKGADALARCLADVLARVPEEAALATLTAEEERELADWEAEKYRQSLSKRAGAT